MGELHTSVGLSCSDLVLSVKVLPGMFDCSEGVCWAPGLLAGLKRGLRVPLIVAIPLLKRDRIVGRHAQMMAVPR